MMYAFHTCVFYPGVQIALTAQTRENSAKLVSDKYAELIKAFPLLKDEIYSYKFSGDTVEIVFHNGSTITNIAAAQSSKGAHVHRGIVDEDNLTNEEIYLDVLEPIFTTVKRKTVGKACVVDPMEMNGSVSPITSSGFRGSPAFYRCLRHFDNMIALKGEMCLGASWELPCFYGRGATKAEIYEYVKKNYPKDDYQYSVEYKIEDYRKTYQWNETCQGSVPVAIRCFLESDDYESFLRNVFSLKCDMDTLCAIGGGIAEEFYHGTGLDNDYLLGHYLNRQLYRIVEM